ncbi:hypothetical protein B9Z55_012301 [Caenorhabditis nigoni]|uniref:Uncharacterized protein n=1 Tax=Caenorhabditis nigoni TaxID=1611254 RepID=A0A2G5TWL6_9PELO|nr:hypothetical protein B9Z55_012301 [Caenorhabditis nigoni]
MMISFRNRRFDFEKAGSNHRFWETCSVSDTASHLNFHRSAFRNDVRSRNSIFHPAMTTNFVPDQLEDSTHEFHREDSKERRNRQNGWKTGKN